MMDSGFIEEVKELLQKGYTSDLTSMKSLGYRHVIKYLNGESTMDEAIAELQADTRRYAKRQFTWFRADKEMIWVEPDNIDYIKEKINEFI